MIDAKTIKVMATRLEKAEALVRSGAVFPVAGQPNYVVVRNGNGDSMYLVRHDAGHECCSCPDYQERQKAAGLPCKHILSAQIWAGEQSPSPTEPEVKTVDLKPGINLLMGKAA